MNTAKISDSVYYIGVNDRTTRRFEGLWPLPYGVSYNSYVVAGADKVAVIDGVETGHALMQIDHIKALLGGRCPDYLVINHMEPDHSGAIRVLRQAYPEITIVGNAITASMVKGFYGIGCNMLEVKDGDTLSLGGGVDLSFHMTPMVHFPETMMTFLASEKVLFSGDAFGCFGALNGAVIDSDMNTAVYFPEMVRYYSNIVGKYGTYVQRALSKLGALEISAICPTHGPVWRSQIKEVVGLYDRLSRYEPLDNGVTVVYGSMYGNTERMAEAAVAALAQRGVRDIAVYNVSHAELSDIIADIFRHRGLVIASPTYSATLFPPVASVIDAIVTRGVKNRSVALMGSFTWAQQAAKTMEARLSEAGITPVVPPVVVKQAPSEESLEEIRRMADAFADTLV